MLTLKAPINPITNRSFVRDPMSFCNRLSGNYALMSSRIGAEDLLHAVTMPPEIYVAEGGMTSLVEQNRTVNHNEEKIEVLNNVLNRIMVSGNMQLTYQDRAYITDVLYRLGIKDDRRFMREVRKFMEETNNTSALIDLYIRRGGDVKSLLEQLEEINKNSVKNTENTYELNLRSEAELNNFSRYAESSDIHIDTGITKILKEKEEGERIREYVERVFGRGFMGAATMETENAESPAAVRENTDTLIFSESRETVESAREVFNESREREINDFRREIDRVISGQKDASGLIEIYLRQGGDIRVLVQNLQNRPYNVSNTEEISLREGDTHTESRIENRQYTEGSRAENTSSISNTYEENADIENLTQYAIQNVSRDLSGTSETKVTVGGDTYTGDSIDNRQYAENRVFNRAELEFDHIDESSSAEELTVYAAETVSRELRELLTSDRQFLRERNLNQEVKESLVHLEEAVAGIAERPEREESPAVYQAPRGQRVEAGERIRDRRLTQREMMEILSRRSVPSAASSEAPVPPDEREAEVAPAGIVSVKGTAGAYEGARAESREPGTAAAIAAADRERIERIEASERLRNFVKTIEDRLHTEEAREIVSRFDSERTAERESNEEYLYDRWNESVERIFYRGDETPDVEMLREFFTAAGETEPDRERLPRAAEVLETGGRLTANEIEEIVPWLKSREAFSYFQAMQREVLRETETRTALRESGAAAEIPAAERESVERIEARERLRDFVKTIEDRLHTEEAREIVSRFDSERTVERESNEEYLYDRWNESVERIFYREDETPDVEMLREFFMAAQETAADRERLPRVAEVLETGGRLTVNEIEEIVPWLKSREAFSYFRAMQREVLRETETRTALRESGAVTEIPAAERETVERIEAHERLRNFVKTIEDRLHTEEAREIVSRFDSERTAERESNEEYLYDRWNESVERIFYRGDETPDVEMLREFFTAAQETAADRERLPRAAEVLETGGRLTANEIEEIVPWLKSREAFSYFRAMQREVLRETETRTALRESGAAAEIPAAERESVERIEARERLRNFVKTIEDRLHTEEAREIVSRFDSERTAERESEEEYLYDRWNENVERIFYRGDETPDVEMLREFFTAVQETEPDRERLPRVAEVLETGGRPAVNGIEEIVPWLKSREAFSYFRAMQREVLRETETRTALRESGAAAEIPVTERETVERIEARERLRNFVKTIEDRLHTEEAREIVSRFDSERTVERESDEEYFYDRWNESVERIFYREDETPDVEMLREFFTAAQETEPERERLPRAAEVLETGGRLTVNEIEEIVPWLKSREAFSYFRAMQREVLRETDTRAILRESETRAEGPAAARETIERREERERSRDFLRSIENRLKTRESTEILKRFESDRAAERETNEEYLYRQWESSVERIFYKGDEGEQPEVIRGFLEAALGIAPVGGDAAAVSSAAESIEKTIVKDMGEILPWIRSREAFSFFRTMRREILKEGGADRIVSTADIERISENVIRESGEFRASERLREFIRDSFSALTHVVEEENTEQIETEKQELYENVLDRLQTGAIYQILSNFNRSSIVNEIGRNELSISEQSYTAQQIFLNRLRETVGIEGSTLVFPGENVYEREFANEVRSEEKVLQEMNSAVFLDIVKSAYHSEFDRLQLGGEFWYSFEKALYNSAENTLTRLRDIGERVSVQDNILSGSVSTLNQFKREELNLLNEALGDRESIEEVNINQQNANVRSLSVEQGGSTYRAGGNTYSFRQGDRTETENIAIREGGDSLLELNSIEEGDRYEDIRREVELTNEYNLSQINTYKELMQILNRAGRIRVQGGSPERTRALSLLSLTDRESVYEELKREEEASRTNETDIIKEISRILPKGTAEILGRAMGISPAGTGAYEAAVPSEIVMRTLEREALSLAQAPEEAEMEGAETLVKEAIAPEVLQRIRRESGSGELRDTRRMRPRNADMVFLSKETLTAEEINETLEQYRKGVDKRIKETENTVEEMGRSRVRSGDVIEETRNYIKQSTEDIDALVRSGVKQQMQAISNEVMNRLERRLRNEKARRGI